VLIGVAMFGSTVYLSLYFQRAKDMSPTEAGLMSICMVGGLLVSSILSGRIISNTGVWKRWLVGGMVAVIAGIGLLATIDASTPLWRTGLFMAVLGLGLGATMQNLVLAVQNTIALSDMGAGSSVVAFFRSLGGSIGIAALGAVLAHQVADAVEAGLTKLLTIHPEYASAVSHDTGGIPDVSDMPAPIRAIFESAFGDATGHIFLVALPFAVGALIAVLFIKEVPLRTSVKREDELMAEAPQA
jgi:MFS family permease